MGGCDVNGWRLVFAQGYDRDSGCEGQKNSCLVRCMLKILEDFSDMQIIMCDRF